MNIQAFASIGRKKNLKFNCNRADRELWSQLLLGARQYNAPVANDNDGELAKKFICFNWFANCNCN